MLILTIYEIDEYGLNILFQQSSPAEDTLKESVVRWVAIHYPDHFDDGMFHDSPSSSLEDNYQAILLWSQFAENASGLRFIIRPADTTSPGTF